ncbi:TIGR02186 family protein [Pelagovum pacificum]|uniref:TIGR02186 family protein n=1 Tax=Pelagovum pacificum TaxID=2588711 RepID=A0A5C5G9R5_9RHOB|nr:TIGR02186 family protein [Pelagovum pacificum]QQA42425.1 TIGR02186 family protein [Pelagovum pacificum]TNY31508.1 hypothetical protein FHY64_15980 [Pelagovum pacificum]
MIRALILFLMLGTASAAETVVLGLSRNEVAITATFDGSEILIFGAVRREQPIPDDSPLHVIITVAGPSEPLVIRRKDRVAGIWINTEGMEIDSAPSFYAISTTGPLHDVVSWTEDLRHHISIPRSIRAVGATEGITEPQKFREALIRIRTRDGAYQLREGTIDLEEETLFNTSVRLPANLTEGNYTTRIFLARNGEVIDDYEAVIAVQKVGLERWLYALSIEQPLIYGLLSLVIAIAAGWGASAVFRAFQR